MSRLSSSWTFCQVCKAENDPVCGMSVDPATAKYKFEHGGKAYYFCCAIAGRNSARIRFVICHSPRSSASGMHSVQQIVNIAPASGPKTLHRRPDWFTLARTPASQAKQQTAYVCPMCPEVRANQPSACPRCGMALEPEMPATATRVEYTCPMHPQIVRPGPGSCPICGMALEPRTVTAQEEENPELREMTRRFWISLALTAPLLAVAMGGMMPGMAVQRLVAGVVGLDRTGAGDAGCAVGRLAIFPAGLDIGGEPLHQHVHPDRDGNRRGVFV